jgi:prepilin-type processing-associated H-X9-DG protein
MKKNNYVQQLWADNPVFIVWKKIPLSMKLLFVFCFCFVGLLASVAADRANISWRHSDRNNVLFVDGHAADVQQPKSDAATKDFVNNTLCDGYEAI